MKNVFEIVLIIFITLSTFMAMVFFVDEVSISQSTVQIRNEIINLIEINGGYTQEVKDEVIDRLEKINKQVTVSVSKEGKLAYGEEIVVTVSIAHKRSMTFLNIDNDVIYTSKGVFYNVLP